MKALFIGGTGTISTEITKLCAKKGWDLTLLNRGNAAGSVPEGVRVIKGDINREEEVRELLKDEKWDVVADFIIFTPEQLQRDLRLFEGKTGQYMFISSASAYQKPLSTPWITEGTPLHNPYWEYSRNKAKCEQILREAYDSRNFPITLIRPSHTYCERSVPVAIHGRGGSFQILERIRQGKRIIIPGDGLTLWSLTHSRDFAVAFEGLMGNPHAIGEAYHIIGDESLTWNQIHECIGRALGAEIKPVHIPSETLGKLWPELVGNLIGDKSNNVLFDNSKIKRAVPEFMTRTRFDQGARECVEYMYSHPECQQLNPEFDSWYDSLIEAWDRAEASFPRYDGPMY